MHERAWTVGVLVMTRTCASAHACARFATIDRSRLVAFGYIACNTAKICCAQCGVCGRCLYSLYRSAVNSWSLTVLCQLSTARLCRIAFQAFAAQAVYFRTNQSGTMSIRFLFRTRTAPGWLATLRILGQTLLSCCLAVQRRTRKPGHSPTWRIHWLPFMG